MHLQYLQVEIYKIVCCMLIEFFTDQITVLDMIHRFGKQISNKH